MQLRTPRRTLGTLRIAVLLALLPACAMGLEAHPLTPAQSTALSARAAPAAVERVEGMTSLIVRVNIDAPVERVWEQLAIRYGEVHRWSGPIADSSLAGGHVEGAQGAVRSCTLGDSAPIGKGKSFEETILDWDPAQHFFVAGVDDGFYPLKRVVQEYWVVPGEGGQGAAVVTQFHFQLAFPMGKGKGLVRRLRPQVVTSLLGLKHLVETGNAQQAQDADFVKSTYPEYFEGARA